MSHETRDTLKFLGGAWRHPFGGSNSVSSACVPNHVLVHFPPRNLFWMTDTLLVVLLAGGLLGSVVAMWVFVNWLCPIEDEDD